MLNIKGKLVAVGDGKDGTPEATFEISGGQRKITVSGIRKQTAMVWAGHFLEEGSFYEDTYDASVNGESSC
jgi:hypothetical protein